MVITSLTISGVRSVVELTVSADRRLIMALLRFTLTLRLYVPESPSPNAAVGDGEVSSHLIVGTVELMLDEFIISLYGASFASFWLLSTLKISVLAPKPKSISRLFTITR